MTADMRARVKQRAIAPQQQQQQQQQKSSVSFIISTLSVLAHMAVIVLGATLTNVIGACSSNPSQET